MDLSTKDSSKESLSSQRDPGGSSTPFSSIGKQIYKGHTHFISLPLATHSKLQDEVNGFQDYLQKMGFDESLFVSTSKLHLTVVMLKLNDEAAKAKAKRTLKDISKRVNDALDNRPVSIRFSGLECMQESFAKARVLYAPVQENGNKARLLSACHVIIDAFVPDRPAAEEIKSRLKLHLTVMTVGKGNPFDAGEIERKYREKDWGEYKIDRAEISTRIDGFSKTYYPSCGSLAFPASENDE